MNTPDPSHTTDSTRKGPVFDSARQSEIGAAGKLARAFIDSKLTPLIIVSSVLLGLGAMMLLPREEEPQIKVPMVDVMVSMPGASAKEVEERAVRPMEQLLWEISGVEYVYSISRPGAGLVIVRFKVGQNVEESLVKLNQKLQSNYDKIPHGVSLPLIKSRSIDDVPILAVTLHSKRYDHLTLRRLAAQVQDSLKQVQDVSSTEIIGGVRRQVRVLIDPAKLASYGMTPAGLIPLLQQANRQHHAGALTANSRDVLVETGGFLQSAQDVANVVIGASAGKPIYLKQVADIVDGAEEPRNYVLFGWGAGSRAPSEESAAVTLSIAKRPGTNAIAVAEQVLARLKGLQGSLIPADVEVTTTRHYGQTAAEKSNELLFHMAIAILSVSLLIVFTLGWRESGVVAVAIPSTLALTLLVFYLYGFTLNRITLFALIFSIGILVDDAIVVVENIVRHYHLPENRGRSPLSVAVQAVNEVGNPTILATFTVVGAVLPMAFVGGLMGPYMRPIPIGSSAAMFFSLIIAFVVTPWAALRLLKRPHTDVEQAGADHGGHGQGTEDVFTRSYRRMMSPLIGSVRWRWSFLVVVTVALLGSMALVGIGWVKVKMLPFDNKSEFQVILNMPEGSSLERTAQAAREIAAAIRTEPEVTDYQVYVGTASPFNFNGLVRHYFMREGSNVADIQVNLLEKSHRKAQSHDIVKRVRPRVAQIVSKYDARVSLAEVPPGPPVLQTLVAEIYGPTDVEREKLAGEVRAIFNRTPGVVDVDWYVEAPQSKTRFVIDKEKAALHGISAESISQTLRIAVSGARVDLVHFPKEKENVELSVELPRSRRTTPEDLLSLRVRSGDANALPEPQTHTQMGQAPSVPLRELIRPVPQTLEHTIYHKNLMPVTYVIGDVAGVVESPVYAIAEMNRAIEKLDARRFGGRDARLEVYNAVQPFTDAQPSIKWDGEWHITVEVFRDLGVAFGAVLVLIYILMVGWFRSFLTPVIVMAAIPFSLVGILPAHGAMGAFFTATSMIGFMAGAGIVVRNSIILVDFIEMRLQEGMPLAEAVVDAGAVRFRPMMLTALAVVVGASVILADPIFQGLAISLMAGELASLFVSRMAVPVLYYMAYRHHEPTSTAQQANQVKEEQHVNIEQNVLA
jgi:multidrug efflux pump subunit AcrB